VLLLVGDFNKLELSKFAAYNGLSQILNAAIRGINKLNMCFTAVDLIFLNVL
jgi:hypothetical protein